MLENQENLELTKFYNTLQQDINAEQLSEEEGGSQEQLLTQYAVDLLVNVGDNENVRVAHDENITPRNRHKVNAFSLSENYETLDLFITILKSSATPDRVQKTEIDEAAKLIANFFRKAYYKDYVKGIEESSEIFELALTLSSSEEVRNGLVRINANILTDGIYPGEKPANVDIAGYKIFYKVIDLNYLYNIADKDHNPIEINFKEDGYKLPCIISSGENSEYQSYLAIIPGFALANIYEKYGSRLLEQNVRSFLQFTGKINKGIRKTILEEPHMFLAFNNGIAATAEEILLEDLPDGNGKYIAWVRDFQIVNGGQTTASVYHTWKKDKKDLSEIFVPVKLSVIKQHDKFSEIVSRIAEYANTQNKVSISDLSSNRPFHIELEKLSRSIWASPGENSPVQTRWFYERARGQYKNARNKEGFTPARERAFDQKNPKSQVFTKEDLAKYINAYREEYDGRKLAIGPHVVVRGSQKNYAQFINYNSIIKPDNVFFEDLIAKAILMRSAEKKYGIKPNSIGDMRYITVPYSIALFGYITGYTLDLYKIWKNQSLSENLKDLLYDLMVRVEDFIKNKAPGSLYGEWAKKEECWEALKNGDFDIDIEKIKSDLEDPKKRITRRKVSETETDQIQIEEEISRLRSIPPPVWHKIEEWAKVNNEFTIQMRNVAFDLAARVRNNALISNYERTTGLKILDAIIEKSPDLLNDSDNLAETVAKIDQEISIELIKEFITWDKKNKKLKGFEFRFMSDLVEGIKPFSEHNKKIAGMNIAKAKKYGFKSNLSA
jgi:hypothetical protein